MYNWKKGFAMETAVSSVGFGARRFSLVFALCCAAAQPAASWAKDVSRQVGQIKAAELVETSGLAVSRLNPDVLWMHNDGDSGKVVAISTTGKLAAVVKCPAKVDDLEEIAIGPGPEVDVDYLYVGDIGDNSERRPEIRIVRIPEPDLKGERGQQLVAESAEEFRLSYPDGPHNAEAMFVDPVERELCIVTKEKKQARLYCVPLDALTTGSTVKLTKAATLDFENISAGTISRDGGRVLLRWEKEGWLWRREKGESVADALARKPEKVAVLGKKQGANGEAVGFSVRGDSYFTVSEGKKEAIYEFELD
jgi:hypothetical protein